MSNHPVVVNLTDDAPEPRYVAPTQIYRPPGAMYVPTYNGVYTAPQNHMNRNPQFVMNRPTQPMTNIPGSHIPYGGNGMNHLIANNLPRMHYSPVTFSLINSKEFTARSDGLIGKEVLTIFKVIPGARFEYATHRWVFPLDAHDILQVALFQNRHTVEPLPRSIIAAAQLKNQRDQTSSSSSSGSSSEDALYALMGIVPDKVLHCLAPFQREAVQFVIKNNGRALVADEMGLGKTRTAIAVATAYRDDWPVLIVCPSSARHHWQAELISILHPEVIESKEIIVVESTSQPLNTGIRNFTYKFVIVSYNLIVKLAEQLEAFNFNVVIADECHYLKSRVAQRTLCLLPIIQGVKRAILLSGTPALSRPIELFPQLHALAPKLWPDVKQYGKRYCRHIKRVGTGINKTNKSWQEFGGASNTSELHLMLTTSLMIRRLKKDVLSQLPKKKRIVERIGVKDAILRQELSSMLEQIREQERIMSKKKKSKKRSKAEEAARYVDVEALLAAKLNNGTSSSGEDGGDDVNTDGVEGIGLTTSLSVEELTEVKKKHKVMLMELFNQSGRAKLPDVLKHLGVFLDNKMSGKVLVFAHHRNVLDGVAHFLKARGENFIRIDGQTSGKERHIRVEYFQTSVCRVAVLAITAAGIAITLTAAATVYFAEIFWTPGSLIQAEDRAHRIGQTSEVTVKYFLADNTVDELLWPLVRKKMRLLGEIVEGQQNIDISATTSSSSTSSEDTSSGTSSSSTVVIKAGQVDWLTDKPVDDSNSSEKNTTKKRSYDDLKSVDGVNNETGDTESQLEELEDLVKEIAKDDTEKVGNVDVDSDDDSGDNKVGSGVKIDEDNNETNNDELDMTDELPDYLAELYMSEQLAINNVPYAILIQQQIVHRYDGSGVCTVMTSKDLSSLNTKSVKTAHEVVDLGSDSDEEMSDRKSKKGFTFSGKCNEVIDLFSEEEDILSCSTNDELSKSSAIDLSGASPMVPSAVSSVSSGPVVVRNDFSNMLTGGLGTSQKSSMYSTTTNRFIPAVVPIAASISPRLTVSPSMKQFTPKAKVSSANTSTSSIPNVSSSNSVDTLPE